MPVSDGFANAPSGSWNGCAILASKPVGHRCSISIRNERLGIDVAFWLMEDARYTAALAGKAGWS